MRFAKGHGTENDFVVLPDLGGELTLTPGAVAAICDRRAGIGADGVLRVVPTEIAAATDPDAAAQRERARWFMDYRNADGSVVEMCGNGIRLFARYLVEEGLADPGEILIATRSGVRAVTCPVQGDVTVDMGEYVLPDLGAIEVRVGERTWPAVAVLMPNPHAVVFVDDLADAGELRTPPWVTPGAFADGVNVEFVASRGPRHLAMRVHERGVGETRSCGTGACAVMVAAARRGGQSAPTTYRVEVLGGRLMIELTTEGRVLMTGPAVLVASGELVVPEDNPSNGSAPAWHPGEDEIGQQTGTG